MTERIRARERRSLKPLVDDDRRCGLVLGDRAAFHEPHAKTTKYPALICRYQDSAWIPRAARAIVEGPPGATEFYKSVTASGVPG